MTNYWIFKVEDEEGGLFAKKALEIFMHRTNEGFWGIKEIGENGKRESNVDSLKKGDFALFFLIGKNINRFIGTCELDSDYIQLDEEQTKKIVHKEYIDNNQGVFIKNVDRWSNKLSVDSLRTEKPLKYRNINIGTFFKGNIKKIRQANDYTAIIKFHKQTKK
ncbi:MAG: EVE domain-containing protein [Crenarchaeota archaeon]|nr:EVE domain-containing protein [Thermoproteota archaeon]